jgi:hypothetical protein
MGQPRNATTTNRGRTYKWRDEEYTSVTTILSGGIPKPALKAWGEKLVAQTAVTKRDIWDGMSNEEAVDWLKRAPFRETDRAAVQGSDIHDWCEQHVLGAGLSVDALDEADPKRPYLLGFLAFLAEWKPRYEMTEATVYSRKWGYAGTLDFLAWIDCSHVAADLAPLFGPCEVGEVLVLGDYKTGKGVYGEVACQLAAYRHAEFIGLPDGTEQPMPNVAGCVVLHLTPKGYELIPVRAGEEEFRSFLYAQQIRHFDQVIAKQVLGSPLASRGSMVPPRPTFPPNVNALVGEPSEAEAVQMLKRRQEV